ncbi:MAG TPA: OmpA family protein [Puia sp.]|jgi:outer membrane protein OmpA-like peptidoglycan-associated protein
MSATGKSFFQYAAWPTLLILLLGQGIQGQNLVPNPSFEDVNTCSEFDQPCSPSAWFYLSRKLTTGYFPRFPSATGSRHLQIVAASRGSVNRQYWETMLLCPLEAGERYTVSLKIASPRNNTELGTTCPNLRDIGLWFTIRFVFVQGDSILQPRSYLSFQGATTRDLKNGWFEIKKEFVPAANSPILIVGNFVRTANTDIMEQRSYPNPTIDILVDDISVVRAKGTVCAGSQKIKDSLYSILRRHSDNHPGDLDPDISDTTPDLSEKNIEPPSLKRSTDSLRRLPSNPVNDPLFGPEPRRVIDTPKLSRRPPVTDTLVIHNIQFDFDKYLVQNPDTLQRYKSLFIRPGIKKIQVVGFTDETGSEAYNLDLSKKRAGEVARILSSKFNISPTLIEAEGRGISRVYRTKDLNRRVEIYIFHE